MNSRTDRINEERKQTLMEVHISSITQQCSTRAEAIHRSKKIITLKIRDDQ